uniref:Uncharacterized protein n=1 Tax=Lactuca sativa TaxID=4236 RepID=A0A9R1WI27_LACSA|nr:hypothetical protein LSAT_V11C200088490 [Lactuca sativa]
MVPRLDSPSPEQTHRVQGSLQQTHRVQGNLQQTHRILTPRARFTRKVSNFTCMQGSTSSNQATRRFWDKGTLKQAQRLMLSALMAPIQPRSKVTTSNLTSKPEMDPNQAKESPKQPPWMTHRLAESSLRLAESGHLFTLSTRDSTRRVTFPTRRFQTSIYTLHPRSLALELGMLQILDRFLTSNKFQA